MKLFIFTIPLRYHAVPTPLRQSCAPDLLTFFTKNAPALTPRLFVEYPGCARAVPVLSFSSVEKALPIRADFWLFQDGRCLTVFHRWPVLADTALQPLALCPVPGR